MVGSEMGAALLAARRPVEKSGLTVDRKTDFGDPQNWAPGRVTTHCSSESVHALSLRGHSYLITLEQ